MPSDSEPPLPQAHLDAQGGAPPLPGAEPPVIGMSSAGPGSLRPLLSVLLGLGLGLFLLDALFSLVDDSLILFSDFHGFSGLRGLVSLPALFMALVIYGLMGLTPMVPKRLFLPLSLFIPIASLSILLCLIYFRDRLPQIACIISLYQLMLGLAVLRKVQGGFRFRWPLVGEEQLPVRRFSGRHLMFFLLLNVFVVLPAVVVYLAVCASLAVDHFSDGFMALRPDGLTVQVRRYVRDDGKEIQLLPMAHIGEPEFYRNLAQLFPTNSIILMEGVSDEQNLLTNRLSYQRTAASLGLAEQQQEFKPSRGRMVRADVDIAQFTTNTIDFLNLVTLLQTKGINDETMQKITQYVPPPGFHERLFHDLLEVRNRHLLGELRSRLAQSENFMIPWGAAHMPEIAREIQKSGFRLKGSQEYTVIRFGAARNKSQPAAPGDDAGKIEKPTVLR